MWLPRGVFRTTVSRRASPSSLLADNTSPTVETREDDVVADMLVLEGVRVISSDGTCGAGVGLVGVLGASPATEADREPFN